MEILIKETELSVLNKEISILRDKCHDVECCPNGDDSGWTSNPESDLTS